MKPAPLETIKQAYVLLDAGMSAEDVAKKLKVSKNTVYSWATSAKRKRYEQALGIIAAPSAKPRGRGKRRRRTPIRTPASTGTARRTSGPSLTT